MPAKRPNVTAYARTVRVYRNLGRIEPQDAAIVALGRTLAEQLDDRTNTSQTTWAYMNVLRLLRGEVITTATSDDDIAALLEVLRSTVGDAAEP